MTSSAPVEVEHLSVVPGHLRTSKGHLPINTPNVLLFALTVKSSLLVVT
jgi:hypothetical protein